MTTTGLLAPGAAEVVDPDTRELLGYVYTIEHGRGQLQRWLLFRHPKNELQIRPPPEDMARWSLDDWQDKVAELWRPDGYYVWARADVYAFGETYNGITWDKLPAENDLPPPTAPEQMGNNFQLDYNEGWLIDISQLYREGKAYVVRGLSSSSSIEYWLLPPDYVPAGKTRLTVQVGLERVASLADFITLCQPSWTPGSTLIITGCVNYTGKAPPFSP